MIVMVIGFMISVWGLGIFDGFVEFVFYCILGGVFMGVVSVLVLAYISEIVLLKIWGSLVIL